jgi:hypothetical protein
VPKEGVIRSLKSGREERQSTEIQTPSSPLVWSSAGVFFLMVLALRAGTMRTG